jgi:AcrR family transcriptional regulator
MASRGRSLTTRGRGKRSTKERTNGPARTPAAAIAPIYKRLPHGPHRMERSEVVLHQRARIHGAIIEAVAQNTYEGTSVKQIIGLAGVSRRSFYEQFANKEECFLATFDLIVRRDIKELKKAYLACDGTLERRARAVFERFAQSTAEDRNATVLVVLEAQCAGQAGAMRLRRATGACEQMLAHSFAESPDSTALPKPIIRGITGGLLGAAAGYLRAGHTPDSIDLADELLRWTLLFQTPAAQDLNERMAARLNVRMREISSTYGHGLRGAESVGRDERTRLLQGILRLVTRENFRELSAPQIADEANLPVETFCELFDSKEECFLEALDMAGDEMLAIAADPALVSDDWPRAVRRVLAELTHYLADHPLHARALSQEAFFSGAQSLEYTLELSNSIATLLTEGAPAQPSANLTAEAVAGAIWHTIRCQAAGTRVQLLAALSDHLAYVVLAPYIGADAAIEIVTEETHAERIAS